MSGGRNPILSRLFAVIGIAVITAGTLFTLKLIYNLWYPPFFNKQQIKISPKFAQMDALSNGLKISDNYTIKYRMPETMSAQTAFHEITIPETLDNVSLCVTCHGLLPHADNKAMRSFRNKHSMNIACETCHIQGSGDPYFKWYNVSTGTIVPNITIQDNMKEFGFKIIALYGPDKNLSRYDKKSEIASALNLLKSAETLSVSERQEKIKPFHNGLRPEKGAVTCIGCHNDSKPPFLPLASLGYSNVRIKSLMTSEIIGMLTKYNEFYLPSFLSNRVLGKEGDATK